MLKYRKAISKDVDVYYKWANDSTVRAQSYNSQLIDFKTHVKWFHEKINDENCSMIFFYDDENESVGQVRIEKSDSNNAIIGISIDSNKRGKGHASKMLEISTADFLNSNDLVIIHAYIKESNVGSKKIFEKAGFQFQDMLDYKNHYSYHYTKINYENR
jgi:RimJ/RimL family protein N-acetyltransferase